jgi:copper chaperone CopZ
MFTVNTYLYIIDSLNKDNAVILKTAMETVPGVKSVAVSPLKGLIEIKAKNDVTDSLKLACSVAKVKLRTKVNQGKI